MPMHQSTVRRDEMSRRAAVSPAGRQASSTPSGWIASKEWTGTHVTGGLTIELERTNPVVRMRASGVLDADTATELSAALLEAVAEQAAGVLIEVDAYSMGSQVNPYAANLLENIQKRKLRVDHIVPLHGANTLFTELVKIVGGKTN